jgi:hypothetical protein
MCPFLVHADNWNPVSSSGTSAIIAYKDSLFTINHPLFAIPQEIGTPPYISKSTNGVNWAKISLSNPLTSNNGGYFRTHNNSLYFFVHQYNGFGELAMIYRTTDGNTFTPVREEQFDGSFPITYPNAISFGDHLYVVLRNGHVIRTSGEEPFDWDEEDTIGPLPGWEINEDIYISVSMAELNDILYVAMNFTGGSDPGTNIYRLTTNNQWEFVGSIDNTYRSIKLFSTSQKLFLLSGYLWEIDPETSPFNPTKLREDIIRTQTFLENWGGLVEVERQPPVAYVWEDNVYVWVEGSQVLKMDPNGRWSFASQFLVPEDPNYTIPYVDFNEKPARLNNKFFVATNRFNFAMQLGADTITLQSTPDPGLIQGQTHSVLGLNITANIKDAVKLTVKNYGTALAGSDIPEVRLTRLPKETVGTFVANDDGKSWHLPDYVPVRDGDQLFITVDVSPSAETGRTTRFAIEPDGMEFELNQDFVLPSVLVSLLEQDIRPGAAGAAGLPPISDVIVFPQPAQNAVQFAYDLTSPSQVTISIFNPQGLLLSEIKDSHAASGRSLKSSWDAAHVPSGTYYARIKIEGSDGSTRQFTKSVFINK